MNDDQIKHMVNRFLAWKLPESFLPDNGISFAPSAHAQGVYGNGKAHWPSGTNLFDYTQAEEMFRHVVEGLPSDER